MAHTVHELHSLTPRTTRVVLYNTTNGAWLVSTIPLPLSKLRNRTSDHITGRKGLQPIPEAIIAQMFPIYDPKTMKNFDVSRSSSGTPRDVERSTIPGYWIKKQPLLPNDLYLKEAFRIGEITTNEIRFCEAMRSAETDGSVSGSQPTVSTANLAVYHGVLVEGERNRVTGVVYERYMTDLEDFVRQGYLYGDGKLEIEGRKQLVEQIVEGVREGLRQVHGLGFVHCDVRASNVFLNFTHTRTRTRCRPKSRSRNNGSTVDEEEEEEEEELRDGSASASGSSTNPSSPSSTHTINTSTPASVSSSPIIITTTHTTSPPPHPQAPEPNPTTTIILTKIVLGDFDAAIPIGAHILHKRAKGKHWPQEVRWGDRVTVEADWFGFRALEKWVCERAGVSLRGRGGDEKGEGGDEGEDEGWTVVGKRGRRR
ncbi:hypothetical protein CC80DRAFT_580833 [Byssothecium circinans]|uniref:non-specific serine/threonine protein kinase n=1 Tax=Byssothecium circinans TaxID=147558 RepID=A0A6A5UAF8_9PLEO|nr:hypothetical protein CC80DRAFT_580833 [Byssothecium circinans]